MRRGFCLFVAAALLLPGSFSILGGWSCALAQPAPGPAPAPGPGGPPPPPCFIATAAYGTPWDRNVVTLRRFRDRYLTGHRFGDAFIRLYGAYSPPIARAISERPWAKSCVRAALIPAVVLAGAALGEPADLALVCFLAAAGFWLLRWRLKKRRRDPDGNDRSALRPE